MNAQQIFKKPLFWLIVLAVSGLVLLIVAGGGNGESVVQGEIGNGNGGSSDNSGGGDNDNDDGNNGNNDNNGGGDGDNGEDGDNDDNGEDPQPPSGQPLVDDWEYKPGQSAESSFSPTSIPATTGVRGVTNSAASSSIGFSVGGAKDIDNFRRNIENGYLPVPTDISHEGLFYDYFFETGQQQACDQLFCPSYAGAVSADPFSKKTEHFLAVGLNSNIDIEDFERKKLNLVIVLDISGSMSSPFDAYYYDQLRNQPGGPSLPEPAERTLSKMEVARRSLAALLKHLEPEDRLGVVLFNSQAHVAKGLRLVSETDMAAIEAHIMEINAGGGTNMEAGYLAGSRMLEEHQAADTDAYENRIIFLTDAMPNLGNVGQEDLADLAGRNARNNVYTSFIGIGLDFNSELVRAITQTRGANYFSVHSNEEFERQLDEGFAYMVTPLVFDLNLRLEAEGYRIKAVYGSPEADLATGEIMRVNTLFPSLRVDDQTRGGLILLHLEKTSSRTGLELTVTYRDRGGRQHSNRQTVSFPAANAETFANKGIRKGVVLARTVNALIDWLGYEYKVTDRPTDYRRIGIPIIDELPEFDGRWERTSQPLVLSSSYRSVISGLRDYLVKEAAALGDENLQKEIEMLEAILAAPQP